MYFLLLLDFSNVVLTFCVNKSVDKLFLYIRFNLLLCAIFIKFYFRLWIQNIQRLRYQKNYRIDCEN